MEKADDALWTLDQCVEYIMRVTGKTRRQARAALVKELRAGSIAAVGDNPNTGKREIIPPDCWPSVN